ncbi:acetyltransferase [Dokdonia pacifica]|uniref:Diamine N-acetyltransferase n=1 Tax=Dokdonia pacifica TaxID=1627892 RepID=A0A239CI06_9FLAO|nr:GNAT family N-acetyltransferase [Dokdonia pacifica]GGG38190.1 acetyltransferase [Dokdonia pacifica]SNS19579.1 diamine N-acetyltransferase [Dokdonia pacifica]
MVTLKGNTIFLRALEPEDLQSIHRIENDERLWSVSETVVPFSVYSIKEYIANAHKDIYEVKQLRLAICNTVSKELIGLIDLFDYDPHNARAGVGILIEAKENRGKGYGKEALDLILNYVRSHLKLHQLYANILEDNIASIQLFTNAGFVKIGVKKDWRRVNGEGVRFRESYKNEVLFQHLL